MSFIPSFELWNEKGVFVANDNGRREKQRFTRKLKQFPFPIELPDIAEYSKKAMQDLGSRFQEISNFNIDIITDDDLTRLLTLACQTPACRTGPDVKPLKRIDLLPKTLRQELEWASDPNFKGIAGWQEQLEYLSLMSDEDFLTLARLWVERQEDFKRNGIIRSNDWIMSGLEGEEEPDWEMLSVDGLHQLIICATFNKMEELYQLEVERFIFEDVARQALARIINDTLRDSGITDYTAQWLPQSNGEDCTMSEHSRGEMDWVMVEDGGAETKEWEITWETMKRTKGLNIIQ